MFIVVNGKACLLPELRTLDALLRVLSPSVPFIVAHNDEIIPRETYGECVISTGDRIEIVHPAAGG
jgi:thiamine biosynthesis protein ThiS